MTSEERAATRGAASSRRADQPTAAARISQQPPRGSANSRRADQPTAARANKSRESERAPRQNQSTTGRTPARSLERVVPVARKHVAANRVRGTPVEKRYGIHHTKPRCDLRASCCRSRPDSFGHREPQPRCDSPKQPSHGTAGSRRQSPGAYFYDAGNAPFATARRAAAALSYPFDSSTTSFCTLLDSVRSDSLVQLSVVSSSEKGNARRATFRIAVERQHIAPHGPRSRGCRDPQCRGRANDLAFRGFFRV